MVHDQVDVPLCKELKTGPFGQNHPEHGVGLFQTAFLTALHRVAIINAGTLYSGYTGFQSVRITEFRTTVRQDIFKHGSELIGFDLSVMKRGRKEPENKNLNKLYYEYGSYLRKKYSNENTVRFYDYEVFCFFQYLDFIQIYELREISAATIVDYLRTMKQSRQRAVLCGLRLYFTFIGRTDLFAVIDGMHAYRPKRIIPVLTDDEKDRLRDTIESGVISNRDAAIVLLGLSTGIRAIDLINLRLSNIDWNLETISFKQSKTGNLVNIPLTLAVGNAIARCLYEERPKVDNDYLFVRALAPFDPLAGHTSCYAIVKNAFKKPDISKDARIFGMHMLRHNAASTMVKNEVPISTISALLGHASTDTTDVYITTDAVRLRECVLPMTGISKEVNA